MPAHSSASHQSISIRDVDKSSQDHNHAAAAIHCSIHVTSGSDDFNSTCAAVKCPGQFNQPCNAPMAFHALLASGCIIMKCPLCSLRRSTSELERMHGREPPRLLLTCVQSDLVAARAMPGAAATLAQTGVVDAIVATMQRLHNVLPRARACDSMGATTSAAYAPADYARLLKAAEACAQLPEHLRRRWDDAMCERGWQLAHRGCESSQGRWNGRIPIVPIPAATLRALGGGGGDGESGSGTSDDEQRYMRCVHNTVLGSTLFEYQKDGVMFGLRHGGRMLLADEMGLGKTLQAIALAMCYQDEWPLLIVCPASLRLHWADECERWFSHLRPSSIHVIESSADRLRGDDVPPITIVSYRMLQILSNDMVRRKAWGVVIVDESHVLRAGVGGGVVSASAQTQAVCALVCACKRAILITGTPSLQRPIDLWIQIDKLKPGLLGDTLRSFACEFCDPRWTAGGPDKRVSNNFLSFAGCHRPEELHVLLTRSVMIRRRKDEVLRQLPAKTRHVVRLRLDKCGESGGESDGEEEDGKEEDAECVSNARRLGRDKLPAVCEWLTNALRKLSDADADCETSAARDTSAARSRCPRRKMLIFAHHLDVLNGIEANVLVSGADAAPMYVRIDGSVDQEGRRTAVQRFRHDPACRVALLGIEAAGVGLDFSAASVVVFAELPREVAKLRQAEDRAHRHGQTFPVTVYFLLARNTFDDTRWARLSGALSCLSGVCDGPKGCEEGGGLKVDQVVFDDDCEKEEEEEEEKKGGLVVAGGGGEHAAAAAGGAEQAVAIGSSAEPAAVAMEATTAGDGGAEHAAVAIDPAEKFFEVSATTGRIHIHPTRDGSRPALGSFHPGDAESSELSALSRFASEWAELSVLRRRQLSNIILPPSVAEALELLTTMTTTTTATTTTMRTLAAPVLPDGCRTVLVECGGAAAVPQQVGEDSRRLCVECGGTVVDVPPCADDVRSVVGASWELFCGARCTRAWQVRASAAAYRRELFSVERGVCRNCGCDCDALARRLRLIAKGDARWEARRRAVLAAWPCARWGEARYANLEQLLVATALDGHAWQADHIVPVALGGGGCSLENFRTLCACCHLDVTVAQAAERARARKERAKVLAAGTRRRKREELRDASDGEDFASL